MTALNKILAHQMRVHYRDCDPFNHLNNSRYIDYMMEARTEQLLLQYGLDVSGLARTEGIGWVAARTQISYFHPASWMELVVVESRLIRCSASSLLVEAFMWDEHKARLKALLWAKLVHFDIKAQKSHRHSPALMQLFESVNDPLADDQTFDERADSFRPRP